MDYKDFFGFKDAPFRLTPDPDYYFPSGVHREALQTLLYSIRAQEGFIQITGDPGTGKTLTLRTLLRQLGDEVTTALILNPRLSPEELLKVILEDLGISPDEMKQRSKEELLRFFRELLLDKAQKGMTTVLIIDEAQNLPNDTLEELRLLSNLETEKKKLLQIILVGQVELEQKLQEPELRQLDQRITIRYRLKPLSREDTVSYINHRLTIAGGEKSARFSPRVLTQVYKASRGVPRLINIISERSLMAAFVDGKTTVDRNHLKKALESIAGERARRAKTSSEAKARAKAETKAKAEAEAEALAEIKAQVREETRARAEAEAKARAEAEARARAEAEAEALEEIKARVKEETLAEVKSQIKEEALAEIKPRPQTTSRINAATPLILSLLLIVALVGVGYQFLSGKTNPQPPQASGVAKGVAAEPIQPRPVQVAAVSEPEPVKAVDEGEPYVPAPPKQVFHVPAEKFFLSVDRDRKRAYLWQGSDAAPILKAEYKWDQSSPNGLFILGESLSHGQFFLNYPRFFWYNTQLPSPTIWLDVSKLIPDNVIPVILYSSQDQVKPEYINRAREVRTLIYDWAETWRKKDLNKLMTFYGNVFTTYYDQSQKPVVYSKDQLYQLKKSVFLRSGTIDLTISDQTCLIDPTNPDMMMAFFHQEYKSRIFSDVGTKALCFTLTEDESGRKTWKIVAKLWVDRFVKRDGGGSGQTQTEEF